MMPTPGKLSRATRLKILAPSVVCFLAACAMPALELTGKEHTTVSGAAALLQGPLLLMIGQLSWLANGLWALALLLVLLSRPRGALIASAGAFLVANHAWALFGQQIPGDEGDVTHYQLKAFHAGFYLWLASFLILAASTALIVLLRPSRDWNAEAAPGP